MASAFMPGQTPMRIGRTLTVQLFSVILLVVVLILGGLWAANTKISYDLRLSDAINRLNGYHAVLTRMIQTLDARGTAEISNLIARDSNIVAFQVVNRFGKVTLQKGDITHVPASAQTVALKVPDRVMPVFTDATATYYVTPSDQPSVGLKRFALAAIATLMATLLISLELYRRLYHSIVRPLNQLHRAVEERSSSNEWIPPRIPGPLEVAELEFEIGRAFARTKAANDRISSSIEALTTVLVNYGLAIRYFDAATNALDYGCVTQTPVAPVLPASSHGGRKAMIEWMRREADLIQGTHFEVDLALGSHESALLELEFEPRPGLNIVVTLFELKNDEYAIVIADVSRARKLEQQALSKQKTEAIGELASGVAHDFNNLLNIILTNAELMRQSGQIDREGLSAVFSACRRGARLTHGLLSFARASKLDARPIDLNQMVSNLMQWSGRAFPENIAVEVVAGSGTWTVIADPAMVESALLNLLLNARDAMPEGGKITIETSNLRVDASDIAWRGEMIEEGRYVMLAVTDTGTGIPPENLSRIFDPFFTTKAPLKGSGVGLSMVLGFMRQSGGTVRVYSELGVGTSLKLFFPADISGRPPESLVEPKEIAITRTEKILLVEDEDLLRRALQLQLEHAGHKVFSAANADEALILFAAEPDIGLLITDLIMPGTYNGPQLARELRRIKPGLAVIIISGYAQESVVHGNGAHAHDIRLTKPISRAQLVQAVEKSLTRMEQNRDSEP